MKTLLLFCLAALCGCSQGQLPTDSEEPFDESGAGDEEPSDESGTGDEEPSDESGTGDEEPSDESGTGHEEPSDESGTGHEEPSDESGTGHESSGSELDVPEEPTKAPGEEPAEEPDAASCESEHLFPDPNWDVGFPEDHGFDPELLAEAADYAEDNRSNCLVVMRHGSIVGEWYFQDSTPTTKVKNWSVAKAWSATVVGVAIDRGDLPGVDALAADWIPQWQGTAREAITLHDLMSMGSGLTFDMMADNVTMPLADDMTALAVAAEAANPPGALWEYNNHSVQAMEPILRAATGMAADEYAQRHLFEPMGMDVEWKRDAVGQPALYMNARASCRDNARMGYLYLRRGCWNGERLLSDEWVDLATSPSTPHNRGYGYWWWLNGQQPTLSSVDFSEKPPGGMHHFAPDDSFCAVGLGNQFIEVVPSLDLVVVRMGTAPQDMPGALLHPFRVIEEASSDGQQVVHNAVLKKVLEALVGE